MTRTPAERIRLTPLFGFVTVEERATSATCAHVQSVTIGAVLIAKN